MQRWCVCSVCGELLEGWTDGYEQRQNGENEICHYF